MEREREKEQEREEVRRDPNGDRKRERRGTRHGERHDGRSPAAPPDHDIAPELAPRALSLVPAAEERERPSRHDDPSRDASHASHAPHAYERDASSAFERLYRRMHDGLVLYAARRVDGDDAQDVVHDAMLKFIEQHDARAPEPDGDARARLVAMVQDVLRDGARRERRRQRLMQLISGTTAAMRRWTNPRRMADDNEIQRAIDANLARIPRCHRAVWVAIREDGLSVTEVAELLDITTGAVRAALSKANHELRQRLARNGFTPATLRGREDR